MRKTLLLILTCILLLSAHAHANLCDSVKDKATTAETKNDVHFYEELFPNPTNRGSRTWNEIVLQCNRQRDTKGNEIAKVTAAAGSNTDKHLLKTRDLEAKVIRGHYNFFGTVVTQLKYVYVLSKKDGVWTMIIPYKPIINELVANRVDFNFDHAQKLYDASQVVNPSGNAQVLTLKPSAEPITTTLCSTSTYFSGDEGKYDNMALHQRDPENKFISRGKIQYRYEKDGDTFSGCRVDENRDLYWQWDPQRNQAVRVQPQDWILDNFVRTAESYWTIPGIFQLKLLMKGRNESVFPKATLDLLQDDDHLTVHFATKFLRYGFNQMYKSNIIQFNNFSTMTTDGTYWHEVGHAFGLDDEYGGETKDGVDKKNGCDNINYQSFSPGTYQMCDAGTAEKRTIYHYLAVSRYITKQSECDSDGDCGTGRYCDKGTLTAGKNQCVELKADNETCDLVGGGHQCKGGQCKFGRCYTPNSVAMGDTCYVDDACQEGKCSSVDGAKGTCVCKSDADCGAGKWCDAGLDTKINACRAKLDKGESCGKAGSVGNDHKCKSGECSGFPKYVCK